MKKLAKGSYESIFRAKEDRQSALYAETASILELLTAVINSGIASIQLIDSFLQVSFLNFYATEEKAKSYDNYDKYFVNSIISSDVIASFW